MFDHLGEFDFALLFRFGVDVEFLPLAAGEPWEEASFPKVVVDLIQASCAALAYLSRLGFWMGLCGRTRGVFLITVYPRLHDGLTRKQWRKKSWKECVSGQKRAEFLIRIKC